jgi:carbamoyltransferase
MYLGQAMSNEQIGNVLQEGGLTYQLCNDIHDRIAGLLADNQVVARFAGRMEFGPRALGHRSILYKATDPTVNEWLNRRLERSEFMPFAPATLAEQADDYFENLNGAKRCAEFMTVTFDCTRKMCDEAPAAVHVDNTARPQIVQRDRHPDLHRILTCYRQRTGLSNLINTSFNMHEEPIVCAADDAVRAFLAGGLPYLAIGDFLVKRESA